VRIVYAFLSFYSALSFIATVMFPGLKEFLHPATESDRIAVLGVEVGILTMLLVAIQIWIAFRQTALQARELQIVERQNEILNAVEDLDLLLSMPESGWNDLYPNGQWFTVLVSVVNAGKGTSGVTLRLYIERPEGLPHLTLGDKGDYWTPAMSEYNVRPRSLHAANLQEFTRYFDLPFPSGRTTPLAPIKIWAPEPGEYVLRWRLESERGSFPKRPMDYGRYEIYITRSGRS
jgi:hypothetical protein